MKLRLVQFANLMIDEAFRTRSVRIISNSVKHRFSMIKFRGGRPPSKKPWAVNAHKEHDEKSANEGSFHQFAHQRSGADIGPQAPRPNLHVSPVPIQ